MIKWYSRWLAEAGDFLGSDMPPLPEPAKLRDSKLLFPLLVGSPNEIAAKLNESFTKVRTTHLVLAMICRGSRRMQPQLDGTICARSSAATKAACGRIERTAQSRLAARIAQ